MTYHIKSTDMISYGSYLKNNADFMSILILARLHKKVVNVETPQ